MRFPIFTFIVAAALCSPLTLSPAQAGSASPAQDAVLITGASSGIGKRIALTLAENGYYVYAGSRKPGDIEALGAIPNIRGIRLDVTIQAEIDAAVATVRADGRRLVGLVNNAGVFLYDPLIEVSEQDMQFVIDVNLFGPYRVTKAFAPLIIESEGRIMTVGSLAGIFSNSLFGPYAMSKHAMEAFTESLDQEMAKFNVDAAIVEPGNFRSDVMKNMRQRAASIKSGARDTLYEDEFARFASFAQVDRSKHAEPTPVAEAVLDFFTTDQPKLRYMVSASQAEVDYTLSRALQKVVELNHDQTFSRSVEELTATLEELFAEAN
ncbi:MAG: SDR family oxidoreductase [Pseudomonadota bacterium]